MEDLNYRHLRYFWAVAHEGNLTRTAARLNISQSALSVQIKRLEERLGHALFERHGRQLRLTEAGRVALDHADAIFAAGRELVGTLRQAGPQRNTVRVGALATLSRNFQISFLRPILEGDFEIILRSGITAQLLEDLDALRLDVVLLNQPPVATAGEAFVSHRLDDQQVSLVGTPALVGNGAPLVELLATHPVILPFSESGVRVGFDAIAARSGVTPRIAAEVDDMAMVRLLAREGVGLAVIPPIVVQDELASGLLMEAHRFQGISETFYAVTRARRFPHPALSRLLGDDA
ncbi:MAG: LysR family transcriptional regulator [Pseudomonadota bacterium]